MGAMTHFEPNPTSERTGWVAWVRRRLMQACAAGVGYRCPARSITLPATPRILLIRLDPRLGNRLLLLPLLQTLKKRFVEAEIDFLGHVRSAEFFEKHPDLHAYIAFDKRRAFGRSGWLACLRKLTRRRYDLCIDAGNPTDPSATQALITRLVGAQFSIGASHQYYREFYTHSVVCTDFGPHEVDMRLALLRPLPGSFLVREASLPQPPRPTSATLDALNNVELKSACLLFVGARLVTKQLPLEDYLGIARAIETAGYCPVVVGGLGEHKSVEAIVKALPTVIRAPELDVPELAWLMTQVRAVVSCDTGPMHLAAAMRTPTCALFVSTNPLRYGPRGGRNCAIDARTQRREIWLPQVASFLAAASFREDALREQVS